MARVPGTPLADVCANFPSGTLDLPDRGARGCPDFVVTMVPDAVSDAQATALRLVGLRVDDAHGARVGRVEAILVDRESGLAQWLHVRVAGFAGGHLALPLRDVVASSGHLRLPHERALMMRSPRVPETGALTGRLERQLCASFSIRSATRGSTVSAWERRATSAKLSAPGQWDPAPRGIGTGIPTTTSPRASSARGGVVSAPAPAPSRLESPTPA